MRARRRFILTTFGSLGDLHPYMAIALGLKARGHEAAIATTAYHAARIQAAGIEFIRVRPDAIPDTLAERSALMKRIMDARRGTEYILRKLILPHLRDSYADLSDAVRGADVLVTHPITFAGPLIAERIGIRWASSVLSPISLFSAYDPPVFSQSPWLARLRPLGPRFHSGLFRLMKPAVRHWSKPVRRFRAELGLGPGKNPLFEGQYAPDLVLALFSRVLAEEQPDYPPNTRITGFPFYDEGQLPEDIERFLDGGPAPLVFTLGSSAVETAGRFYQESAAAAKLLGRRALLLIGSDPRNRIAESEGVATFEYAPHAALFPRAAAIVHQGGVGTTAQALRSGRPAIVVPFSHDQFDNAARVARAGAARVVHRKSYSAARIAQELDMLLHDAAYAERAADLGRSVRAEDGVGAATDALECF